MTKQKIAILYNNKKNENHLKYFFNCAFSLDFFLIENYLQPPKQHLKKYSIKKTRLKL